MLRRALIALCLITSSRIAFGSLWESPDWALLGTLNGATGYDSNLTLLHDGPGGFYVTANPYLTLSRQNSDTDILVNGGATREEFLSGGQPSVTDLSFNAAIAYPNTINTIPVYKFYAGWLTSSQPNEFLGERIQNTVISFTGEGYIKLTGKLGLRGNLEFDSVKYDAVALNDSLHGSVVAGLTYSPYGGTESSINVGTALAQSTPNDPSLTANYVRSQEYDVTLRFRGQMTDKITGDIYGGFGVVDYTGGYSNHNDLPVAGADVAWGLDPRRTLVLAAYSGVTYAPDGTAVQTAHAFLSYTDVIIAGWQFTARCCPTRNVFNRQVFERTDEGWDFGMEFAYDPSKHFKVALDVGYAVRNDDVLVYKYTHASVSLGSSYTY